MTDAVSCNHSKFQQQTTQSQYNKPTFSPIWDCLLFSILLEGQTEGCNASLSDYYSMMAIVNDITSKSSLNAGISDWQRNT